MAPKKSSSASVAQASSEDVAEDLAARLDSPEGGFPPEAVAAGQPVDDVAQGAPADPAPVASAGPVDGSRGMPAGGTGDVPFIEKKKASPKPTQPPGDANVFDPYAPCPVCGEFYPHIQPQGADLSNGIAYPSLVHHYAQKHQGDTPPPAPTPEG